MKLAIVIPAHNEESTIGAVLKSLPRKIKGVDEITSIVVDDGSDDNTYEIAKRQANYVIKHAINLGQGAAFSTSFKLVDKLRCDLAVTFDADGQHDPGDIERVIQPILGSRADVVNGSRMFNTKGMPTFKVFGNWFMNFITFLIYGVWVSDSQSGMRAFSKKALDKIKIATSGHEVCSEIIGEAKYKKLRIVEVPIKTIYTDYSKRKGQNWLNGVNILTKLITVRLAGKK